MSEWLWLGMAVLFLVCGIGVGFGWATLIYNGNTWRRRLRE